MDRNRYAEPGHIAQRKNRCSGSAEASYTYLFPKEGYGLTVDTHACSAEDCALQILRQDF